MCAQARLSIDDIILRVCSSRRGVRQNEPVATIGRFLSMRVPACAKVEVAVSQRPPGPTSKHSPGQTEHQGRTLVDSGWDEDDDDDATALYVAPAGTSVIARANEVRQGDPRPKPDVPSDASDLHNKISILFGASLFDTTVAPRANGSRVAKLPTKGSWGVRIIVVSVALVVLTMTVWLIGTGASSQTTNDRARVAVDMFGFLKNGELSRASQFLSILTSSSDSLDPLDPHLDLVLRVEAFLYRYYDADVQRLRRVQPYLAISSVSRSSPQRIVAGLDLLSHQELVLHLPLLKEIGAVLAQDPEYYHLLAIALERSGEVEAV